MSDVFHEYLICDFFFEFEIYLEPCVDRDILFQCPRDYPHSCIDRKLQCNGRSECPSGDDERGCHRMLLIYINKTLFRHFLFNFSSSSSWYTNHNDCTFRFGISVYDLYFINR
jgi:hypothetical protein